MSARISFQNRVGIGIADCVEELAATVDMAPTLGMGAAFIGTRVKVIGPGLVRHVRGWPHDVRLPRVAELDLGPRAAIRTIDQQQGAAQCATAAAAASLIMVPRTNRSSPKGATIGCGASWAIVCAKRSPDPGVALKPPVPQPQFT